MVDTVRYVHTDATPGGNGISSDPLEAGVTRPFATMTDAETSLEASHGTIGVGDRLIIEYGGTGVADVPFRFEGAWSVSGEIIIRPMSGHEHSAIWDETKYHVEQTNGTYSRITTPNTTVIGMQYKQSYNHNSSHYAFLINGGGSHADGMMIRDNGIDTVGTSYGFYGYTSDDISFRNCVYVRTNVNKAASIGFYKASGTNVKAYNCISDEADQGYKGLDLAENCIAMDCNTAFESMTGNINNCCTETPTGANPVTAPTAWTDSFPNYATYDYNLSASDTALIDTGVNETAIFTTDIHQETRPATGGWAMGADEIVGATNHDGVSTVVASGTTTSSYILNRVHTATSISNGDVASTHTLNKVGVSTVVASGSVSSAHILNKESTANITGVGSASSSYSIGIVRTSTSTGSGSVASTHTANRVRSASAIGSGNVSSSYSIDTIRTASCLASGSISTIYNKTANGVVSYIGIPNPDFGGTIGDPRYTPTPWPTEWDSPSSEKVLHFYVGPNVPGATDDLQGGEVAHPTFGRLGHPDKPRLTIPNTSWNSSPYEAGMVVWLKGGTYYGPAYDYGPPRGLITFTGDVSFYGDWNPQLMGTATSPTWIIGDPVDPPVFHGVGIQTSASSYGFIQGLKFDAQNKWNNVLSTSRSDRGEDIHHMCFRSNIFHNLEYIQGGSGILAISSGNATSSCTDIVAYDNEFKSCGMGVDWLGGDYDQHGIKVTGTPTEITKRIWVLKNRSVGGDTPDPFDGRIKSVSGNLLQVSDESPGSYVSYIFTGGNTGEFGRQPVMWNKICDHTFHSENVIDGSHYNMSDSNGQLFGGQNVQSYAWWFNNVAHNGYVGFQMGSSGVEQPGPIVLSGNIIYDIWDEQWVPGFWRKDAAITMWGHIGAGNLYVVNNTCYNVGLGFYGHNGGANKDIYAHNNIFHTLHLLAAGDKQWIRLEGDVGDFAGSRWDHNTFYDTGNLQDFALIDGTTYSTLANFEASVYGTNNVDSDPLLTNPGAADFTLQATSNCIDAGTELSPDTTDIWQMFVDTYTSDPDYPGTPFVKYDHNGNARSVGVIDKGAYEVQGAAPPTATMTGVGSVSTSYSITNQNGVASISGVGSVAAIHNLSVNHDGSAAIIASGRVWAKPQITYSLTMSGTASVTTVHDGAGGRTATVTASGSVSSTFTKTHIRQASSDAVVSLGSSPLMGYIRGSGVSGSAGVSTNWLYSHPVEEGGAVIGKSSRSRSRNSRDEEAVVNWIVANINSIDLGI